MDKLKRSFISLFLAAAIAIPGLTVFAEGDNDIVTDYASPETIVAEASEQPEATEEAEELSNFEKFEESGRVSVEYQAYELISQYIADLYLDDTYTAEDIMNIGISSYLGENGDAALVALLKAALHSIDDYSDFYTYSEYVEYTNNLNKTFYGLGINMQQAGEYVEIVGFVEEGGLAEQSGFKVGDKIVKVDGINVVGSSTSEVRNLVIGELGTTVLITVDRDGTELELTGTRTAVNDSTVTGGILEGNIGYIKISSFSANTASEYSAVSETLREAGVTDVILDLRNNPGGLLSAAVDIAKQTIPSGKIVDVQYRNSEMNYTYESDLDVAPFKMVVLVNGNTASSAEILASAIQESKTGILMGEQTYGKAVIQSTYSLNNGMVLKLTIGQYLTRNGNKINGEGLTPDEYVDNYYKKIDTSSYSKFDFLTPVSVGGSGENVSAAKERLSIMGYFIGNLGNDVFNVDLYDAVKKFQSDNGLTDTGVLDVPTQIKLKEVFEQLETTVDIQMQEAYKYFGGNVEDL